MPGNPMPPTPAPPSGWYYDTDRKQHISPERHAERSRVVQPQPEPAKYGGYSTLPSNLESRPHPDDTHPHEYLHRNMGRHLLTAMGHDPEHIAAGPEGTATAQRLHGMLDLDTLRRARPV
jgi:hypothetical protein